MDRKKVMYSVTMFFATLILGFTFVYSIIFHPVSNIHTERPEYLEIKKDALVFMSQRLDLEKGRLFRYKEQEIVFISRVVGLPEDLIEFKSNTLYVNGRLYDNYTRFDIPDSELYVPLNHVFRFPDNVATDNVISHSSIEIFLVHEKSITGTVLRVYNRDANVYEYLSEFIFGIAIIVLFLLMFYLFKRHKELIYKPVYYFGRTVFGVNLLYISIAAAVSISLLQYDFVFFVAVYYIFISWLTFVGLSISESTILTLFITLFGLVTAITDLFFTSKSSKSSIK